MQNLLITLSYEFRVHRAGYQLKIFKIHFSPIYSSPILCHNKQGKHGFHYKKKEKNGVTKNIDINIVSYLISMARSRVPTIVEIETEIDIPLTSALWSSFIRCAEGHTNCFAKEIIRRHKDEQSSFDDSLLLIIVL